MLSINKDLIAGHGEILLRGKKEQTDNKTEQWFGATLQSAGENGIIVVRKPFCCIIICLYFNST